jgi:threonine-phosphate decarboxylase
MFVTHGGVVTHGGDVFAAARAFGCDWRNVLDFSASINPLGPAAGVRGAIVASLDRIAHYPDRYASHLQNALAELWNVEPECILLGNGATELIHFLARTWHIEATLMTPVFSEFHRAYPNALLDAPGGDGLLVITNPVNPTGAASHIPDHGGPILVDESFIEFSDLPTQMHNGHIVLRSLTKFHALPGLRIGALVAPGDLIKQWRGQREPWQVNVLAEAAALAAIQAKEHHRITREFVHAEQTRLWDQFRILPGVQLSPTHANFYFARLTYSAATLCQYMRQHRLLLRDCSEWPGIEGQAVRFAIRTREENDKLLELWRAFPCD